MTDPTPSGRLFKRLYISLQDLGTARQFAEYLLKKRWHYDAWEKRGSIYLQQSAFTTSLIVFYARPFTKSYGLPEFPRALVTYGNEEEKLHQTILDLRHQVYAHSDSSRYQVTPFREREFISAILRAPFFKLERSRVLRLRRMITKLINATESEMGRVLSEIESGNLTTGSKSDAPEAARA